MFKPVSYDPEANAGYIRLVEPLQFKLIGCEDLTEDNYDIILDLGEEVPIVGVELVFRNASKLANIDRDEKVFNRKGDTFSFRLDDKPIRKTITYEGIPEIKFLFADEAGIDLIGIDVCSDNPYYVDYLSRA